MIFAAPMRDRLPGYTPDELDRIIFACFLNGRTKPSSPASSGCACATSAPRWSASPRALPCWRIALAGRVDQIDELARWLRSLAGVEDPPHVAVTLRVRVAALRQSFARRQRDTHTGNRPPRPRRCCARHRQPAASAGWNSAGSTHTPELAAAE